MRRIFTKPAKALLVVAGAVAAVFIGAKLVEQSQADKPAEGPMEISDKERYWMNNKLYQFWRFVVLNLKILKAVDHSKRA